MEIGENNDEFDTQLQTGGNFLFNTTPRRLTLCVRIGIYERWERIYILSISKKQLIASIWLQQSKLMQSKTGLLKVCQELEKTLEKVTTELEQTQDEIDGGESDVPFDPKVVATLLPAATFCVGRGRPENRTGCCFGWFIMKIERLPSSLMHPGTAIWNRIPSRLQSC